MVNNQRQCGDSSTDSKSISGVYRYPHPHTDSPTTETTRRKKIVGRKSKLDVLCMQGHLLRRDFMKSWPPILFAPLPTGNHVVNFPPNDQTRGRQSLVVGRKVYNISCWERSTNINGTITPISRPTWLLQIQRHSRVETRVVVQLPCQRSAQCCLGGALVVPNAKEVPQLLFCVQHFPPQPLRNKQTFRLFFVYRSGRQNIWTHNKLRIELSAIIDVSHRDGHGGLFPCSAGAPLLSPLLQSVVVAGLLAKRSFRTSPIAMKSGEAEKILHDRIRAAFHAHGPLR